MRQNKEKRSTVNVYMVGILNYKISNDDKCSPTFNNYNPNCQQKTVFRMRVILHINAINANMCSLQPQTHGT